MITRDKSRKLFNMYINNNIKMTTTLEKGY